MPEIPEKALKEATAAYWCAYHSGVSDEEIPRVVVQAAAGGIREDERRKVAEQIAAEITKYVDPHELGPGPRETEAYRNGLRLAARIAHRIGDARDPR